MSCAPPVVSKAWPSGNIAPNNTITGQSILSYISFKEISLTRTMITAAADECDLNRHQV
jgi:hypothetical protein